MNILQQYEIKCCNLEGPLYQEGQIESSDQDCKISQSKRGIDFLISSGLY